MDCIHYKVREDGRILSRAAYVVLGVTTEGHKEILSITVGANESSKFWLGMLSDLKNRGVQDVLFFCVDGLPGFKEAISAVFPQSEIQRCVIHMLRNSFKYVNYSDLKNLLPISRQYTMLQTRKPGWRHWQISGRNGERSTPMQSATGKTTGRMSARSSSFLMKYAALCTQQISLRAEPPVQESHQDKKCVSK